MATTQSITTAEQLLRVPDSGRGELVKGALVMMTPAGFEHGRVGIRLAKIVFAHHSDGRVVKWTGDDAISGDPVLPGFKLLLAELFGG